MLVHNAVAIELIATHDVGLPGHKHLQEAVQVMSFASEEAIGAEQPLEILLPTDALERTQMLGRVPAKRGTHWKEIGLAPGHGPEARQNKFRRGR